MTGAPVPPSIDGYRVLQPLGQGSMGTVWRAVDRSGREVAVKLPDRAMRVSAAQRDEMFRREALAALNLHHPNLVRGLEVGTTTDGRTFLAMELVEGESLGHRLRTRGPLGEREVIAVGLALAGALEHAHARGLLHRDVKPDNVMRIADGSWKLIDLSLVSERGYGELGCGTPGFASPEMILKRPVGPASDLFAVGVTLASAALGRAYFAGSDVQGVLRATLRTPVELPPEVGGRPFSEGLRAVVARLGRRDPADRYGSAAELRLDLEAVAHGQRPLGALLTRGALRRPRRGRLVAAVVAPAAIVVGVVAVAPHAPSRGVVEPIPVPRTPVVERSGAPPPVAAADPGDAEVGAVLLYVRAHPDDSVRGRDLIAARLAADPTAAQRARLDEAAAVLATHELRRAEGLLAAQSARAAACRDRGDTAGIVVAFADWPPELRTTAPAAEARRRAAAWRADALREGAALARDAGDVLERWTHDTTATPDAQRVLEAIDAFLSSATRDPDQRAALTQLRVRIAARSAELELRTKSQAAQALLAEALTSRGGGEGSVGAALARLAAQGRGSELAAAATTVVELAHGVEGELREKLRPTRSHATAFVVDGRVSIGSLSAAAGTADAFGPTPVWGPPSTGDATARLDLEAAVPDRARASAWLLVQGFVDAAATHAPDGGAVRELLRAAGPRVVPVAPPPEGVWAELARRLPLTLRPIAAPAPAVSATDGPLLRAWAAAVSTPPRRPAASRGPAALARARATFLDDDLAGAWTALAEAVAQAPDHPEVALLRAGVLHAAGARRPTAALTFLAFSEARRAWELDPTLPAGPRLVADAGLRFVERFGGALGLAIGPALLAACEDALQRGQGSPAITIHVAAARLAGGRGREALAELRRAVRDAPEDGALWAWVGRAEATAGDAAQALEALLKARRLLGLAFPDWARALAEELARR